MTKHRLGRFVWNLGLASNQWLVLAGGALLLGCSGNSGGSEGTQDAGVVLATGGASVTTSIATGGKEAFVVEQTGGADSLGGATQQPRTTLPPPVCGNGQLESGELCDDGNTTSGDGCTADCSTLEEFYACPNPGQACVLTVVCGDKKISGEETCDDGNTAPNDGCSANCELEEGWTCPVVGTRCIAAKCGDGLIRGTETCDDGNGTSGDGCNELCAIENPLATERDAWMCPEAGKPCVRTTCGNGVIEGTEQCDDQNNDSGDGCSPACRKEPKCPPGGGACVSVCGDGVILSTDTDQECDDGNSADGDGCSSNCKVEQGYQCPSSPLKASGSVVLPIVYRDFKGVSRPTDEDIADGNHPDFEHASGMAETGIVKPLLGADGKPVHSDEDLVTTTNNDTADTPDWFSLWYRDAVKDLPKPGAPRYNYTFVETLTLTETSANSGAFRFTSSSFFPLDGRGWGNTARQSHNFHFTSEVRYWFQYGGSEQLSFKGDDDVFVFVNKRLAVDLGGIHVSVDGSVTLDASNGTGVVCQNAAVGCANSKVVDFGLELGKVYEIVVFQAERHTIQSNYTLTVSAFKADRSVCSSVCGDAFVTPDEACDLGKDANTGEYGTCNPDCSLPPYCGDKNTDTADGEECDDGVNLSTYGYNNTPSCNPNCKFTGYCGDGKVDSIFGEECDDGNHVAHDGCEPNCMKGEACGNGVLDPGEQCDDGNILSGDSCSEFCRIEVDFH